MAILDFYCESSYWQIYPQVMPNNNFLYIPNVRTDTWQIYPPVEHLVAKHCNVRFLLWELMLADQLADLPPPVMPNGNFLYIPTVKTDQVADQLSDLPPPRNHKWQFLIDSYCENWYLAADME